MTLSWDVMSSTSTKPYDGAKLWMLLVSRDDIHSRGDGSGSDHRCSFTGSRDNILPGGGEREGDHVFSHTTEMTYKLER